MGLSKKSQRLSDWVVRMYEKVGCPDEIIALEEAARIVTHDMDTMGEPSAKSLHALARASKELQEAYGKE